MPHENQNPYPEERRHQARRFEDKEPISNETLAVMIGNVADDVGEIKVQTKLTNGRVSSLEKDKDERTGEMRIIKLLLTTLAIPVALLVLKVILDFLIKLFFK